MGEAGQHTLPPAVESSVRHRLHAEQDFALAAACDLKTPVIHNNRLYRLTSSDGRELLLKLYQRDGRRRLEREWAALTFLHARDFASVPTPYVADDTHYYAVYSFEAGANVPAAHWTEADAAAAGAFAAALHRITPIDSGADFLPAFAGTFSYADMLAGIRRRFGLFSAYATLGSALPPSIQDLLAECDPVAEVERLITAALRGLTPTEIDARIPPDHHRLSSGDFAPHNVLIRPAGHVGGHLCVVDHEYFGWDEPAALVAGFLTAEQALTLPPDAQRAFLDAYVDAGSAPPGTLERIDRVGLLMHLSWCGVHLQLTTPEGVARKRFATPTLDVDAMLADQTAKFLRRLAIAETAVRLQ